MSCVLKLVKIFLKKLLEYNVNFNGISMATILTCYRFYGTSLTYLWPKAVKKLNPLRHHGGIVCRYAGLKVMFHCSNDGWFTSALKLDSSIISA